MVTLGPLGRFFLCWTTFDCVYTGGASHGDGRYPLVTVKIAMEHCPFRVIFPLNMVVFHSYVSLPEDMCKNGMTEKHFHIPIFDIYGDLMGRKILTFHIANGKTVESVMGQAAGA